MIQTIKNTILSLNPYNIIKRIFIIFKELRFFYIYSKSVDSIFNELREKEGSSIQKSSRFSMIKGVSLKTETLLYMNKPENELTKEEKEELEKFELSFVSKEISKHNDIFIREGVIELIKTKANRVKNDDYYGYMVEIYFNWNHAKPYNIIRLLVNISFWVILLSLLPYSAIFQFI